MATKNGSKKNGWEKIKGVLDLWSGKFLPYPLPISGLTIADESYWSVDMALAKDDPRDWGLGEGESTPLVVEFKVRFFINDSDGRYLVGRSRQLGVEPEDLPKKCTLPVTDEEENALYKALEEIREALWYPMLRWAHLLESEAPIPLFVPAKVPVGTDPEFEFCNDGPVPVRNAVVNTMGLRDRAREHLRGEALNAFNAYCDYWDEQHELSEGE